MYFLKSGLISDIDLMSVNVRIGVNMKYIKQFMIIMVISFMGECVKALLPFMIPASVYGLVIMLIALMTGIVKLEAVKDTAEFFVQTMPVMFIPPTVGLLAAWPLFKDIVIPFCVVCAVTTIIVMIVTGHMSQLIIRLKKRRNTDKKSEA